MRTIAFLLCLALGAVTACTTDPVSLKIKLYGQGANFTGRYALDDNEEEVDFSGSETTSGVYLYSTSVEAADRVIIDVFPEADDDGETDMTDLTCRIYDADGNTVYENSIAISSTLMKTFEFDVEDMNADE